MRSSLVLGAAVALFTAGLACGQSNGVFAGAPAAISVRPGAGALDPGQILIKRNGFTGAAPTPWTAGPPSFNLRAILQTCGAPAGMDVDDFSLGQDWVLADNSTGEVQVPANRWAAFTFSVTNSSTGTPGSRVAAEVAAAGNAGSAVFSYVLQGSILPAPFVSRVTRAHSAAELGLGAMPAADVDGLDHMIPIYALESGMRALVPGNPAIYFTVPNASVATVPVQWWGNQPPSGASILRVQFIQATWTCPQVWRSFRDLGLAQGEDITGLAIDLSNQRILFSTRTATRDPLQFVYYGTDLVAPMDYKEPGGATPVSSSIGLGVNDGVDAICSMDPSIRQAGPAGTNPLLFYCGYPIPPFFGPTAPLNASAWRNYSTVPAPPVLVYDTYMTGWPPVSGRGPGFAAVLLTFGNATSPAFSLAPLFVRNPANPFAGDPQHYALRVPLGFSLVGGGTVVTFRWFAVNSAFTELAEAWPTQVRI